MPVDTKMADDVSLALSTTRSSKWVQMIAKTIANVPKIARKEIEDLLKTSVSGLDPPPHLGPFDQPEARNHEMKFSNWIRLIKLAKLINLTN